jgi:DNA repair protein RadC
MTVSIGTLGAALVHPRDVFREAIRRNVAAVVLVHNHPSGDPEPSRDDIELTRRLSSVGKLVGIEVIDHVIVAKDGYVSLRERGGAFADEDESESRAAANCCSKS